jgi:hypothetical protein
MDDLTIHNGFSDRGAPLFLKIYDGTIAFAGLSQGDKIEPDSAEDAEVGGDGGNELENEPPPATDLPPPPPPLVKGAIIMDGERELTTGLLSRDASFRLIVSGPIGVREIERLIRKLELDKEILADEIEEAAPDERT